MIGRNYSKFLHGFFCAFVCLFLINLLCTLHFAFPKRLVTFSLINFSPIQSSVQHKRCEVPVSCQGLQEIFIDATGQFHALDAQLEVGIYSVFLDKRKSDNITEKRSASGHSNGVLRVFLAKRRIPSPKLYCHFIGTNGEVRTVASRNLQGREFAFYELTENHMRPYGGYSVHCDAPDLNEPVSTESGYCGVAISSSDAYVPQNSALFKVPVVGQTSTVLPSEEKPLLELEHRFGVCVPALHNMEQLNPWRLDEWIEIHMHLGVTKFRFYYTKAIVKPLLSVLTAPRSWKGLAIDIELIPLMWSDHPEIISRRSWYFFQIITVNDCLYRSMRDVDFVFFGDIDEILVPVSPTAADWGTLTDYFWGKSSHNLTRPGYCFDSAIFPTQDTEEFEQPFHRDYTRRVEKLDSMRRKCLVRPLWIFEMGIHHVSKPYEESTAVALNAGAEHSEMAIVHHYRKGDINSIERTIEDKSLERFLP